MAASLLLKPKPSSVIVVLNQVLRSNLSAAPYDAAATARACKSLAHAARAFHSMKTFEVGLRPVLHWTAPRVRGHV